ncbi:endonuclease III, DNA-(apurinic or apyrimidinic site) lyase [Terriglobus roseus DSM 18391]|uniref:Endonuclease III n=1 Tax=Terriglobus roseus (strain DSM 18391 / NRRL B-41598 / KBS 63) TaxID=926566 RepID=I3ZHV0_TERRK|nr:endonuclease III [Terriglobus roseus]AFL88477.1 endonuclease III, DNA-(apurinic or apyrimidinic site) lyase [Terriglobus roseus DSM 18391]AFL88818.1 endonuclease III, DNA-(apurinic or apyrimidinic site) lyase [Terriglobus roseus DSM 18391]
MAKVVKPAKPLPAKKAVSPAAAKGIRARQIAASEPVATKKAVGRTKKPLAPERIAAIIDALAKTYPDAVCALHHSNAWELTVATILSAQCTDARVNMVTPALFHAYPTPKAMAHATPEELQPILSSLSFFRMKAKSLVGAAKVVTEEFGGQIPQTMDEMLRIPGAARKTSNVVLGSWYGIASGVVVDTHVLRLSRRLELTLNDDPVKVERDLMQIIPQTEWINFSHRLIHHGRQICEARKPKCVDCSLETVCNSSDKTWSTH